MNRPLQLPRIRVILLVLVALASVQLALAISGFWQATRNAENGFAFPLPERLAAIVTTVDRTPESDLPATLKAMSDDRLTLTVLPEEALDASRDDGGNLDIVAQVIEGYIARLGDEREVLAWLAIEPDEKIALPRLETGRLYSAHPLRMAVSLRDGRWLVAETRGDLARTVFGFPPGLWAGVFGVTVALLSLLLLWRSLAPVPGLARAIRAFASDQEPKTIRKRGPAEIREIAADVEKMQREISRLLEERLTMLGALAHDLRTYLTRLRLRVESVADIEHRAKAIADIESMSALSEAALDFARLGTQPVNLQLIDIVPLVRTIAERNAAPCSGCNGSPIMALADPVLLDRAVENLLGNATKHANGGELSLNANGKVLSISVIDHGPGFPFERIGETELISAFARGDDARTLDRPGVGLGLAIADRAARAMGGSLTLTNRPEGGAQAIITLPLVSAVETRQ